MMVGRSQWSLGSIAPVRFRLEHPMPDIEGARGGGEPGSADPPSVWRSTAIRLRAVEPEDWPLFARWNEDDDSARRLYSIPFPQPEEAIRRWTAETASVRPDDDRMRWIIGIADGESVGTISTHGCDRRNGTFGYGVHVDAAYRGRGYAGEAIRLVLRFYFGELRYQKANVHVYAFNAASIGLHERLGFRPEGRMRRSVYTAGAFHDVLLYGLTDDEFMASEMAPRR